MFLIRLWRGEVPLEQTFWTWGVLVALVVNMSTTVGSYVLLTEDRPVAAFVVGYLMSVPYNLFMLVAVWRAVARFEEDPRVARRTRIFTVLWMTLLSLT
jgi:hypothetical protein